MLKIGKMTDYAMLITSQLAKSPRVIMSATTLAETLFLTVPTVSKILKMLSDADLVLSVRGAEGGYRLAKEAADISVADIIAAMEGDLALTECCESRSLCSIDAVCLMKENWKAINHMVYSLLSRITIHDMRSPLAMELIHGK